MYIETKAYKKSLFKDVELFADSGFIYAINISLCGGVQHHIVCNLVTKDFHQH